MPETADNILHTYRHVDPLSNYEDIGLKKPMKQPLLEPVAFQQISPDYKISVASTVETQMRKLKLSMEPWRELILQVNDALLWEKPWHPTALLCGNTLVFFMLFMFSPNVLTILSILGLIITLADCFMPVVLGNVFKSDTWTVEKQKQYEEICTNIVLYKTKMELLWSSYGRLRVTNSKLYFSVTILVLCLLTWIGGAIDNTFLGYICVNFVLMLPGMLRHGMLKTFAEMFAKLSNNLIENAKSRVAQKKAH
ncbi:ADP-ribosylation factor-like protein 6-interacting protein 1 [Cylas formicarius]|uniref:ADP-ribosylation factor-like protein 6-interacting protein 1 n=1 Tax=Cylas formicarius TaxID=197179 RepID=UPI0029584C14|nr:ADP-ribosylation factor-like protein 6-interacting protein 1 [Cylas formicarius]